MEEVAAVLEVVMTPKVEVPVPPKNWSASMSPVASRLAVMVEVPVAPLILIKPPIMALSVVCKDLLIVRPCKLDEAVVEVAVN